MKKFPNCQEDFFKWCKREIQKRKNLAVTFSTLDDFLVLVSDFDGDIENCHGCHSWKVPKAFLPHTANEDRFYAAGWVMWLSSTEESFHDKGFRLLRWEPFVGELRPGMVFRLCGNLFEFVGSDKVSHRYAIRINGGSLVFMLDAKTFRRVPVKLLPSKEPKKYPINKKYYIKGGEIVINSIFELQDYMNSYH